MFNKETNNSTISKKRRSVQSSLDIIEGELFDMDTCRDMSLIHYIATQGNKFQLQVSTVLKGRPIQK